MTGLISVNPDAQSMSQLQLRACSDAILDERIETENRAVLALAKKRELIRA
jgi:hypothetical protein